MGGGGGEGLVGAFCLRVVPMSSPGGRCQCLAQGCHWCILFESGASVKPRAVIEAVGQGCVALIQEIVEDTCKSIVRSAKLAAHVGDACKSIVRSANFAAQSVQGLLAC